jgi:molybdopterin/thiamine biosynthesis adenylyltransferase
MNRDEQGSLTEEQRIRYRRQLAIPEIGVKGQIRLGKARVMIAGLGGLGSVSSFYLAAAGVGCLRIVDHDTVSLDNLNRQLLHSTPDLDQPKAESAAEKLRRLNPGCLVEPVRVQLAEESGFDVAEGCDLILDATDNLAARHVLNRISLTRRIPLIYGGINGWNGTVATFLPGETCCLSCLFPAKELGRPGTVFPALGPAAGVIGSIQGLEAVRILLGMRPALANRLLDFQGNGLRFRIVRVEKDPFCAQCGRIDRG